MTWDDFAANLVRELTTLPDNAIGAIFRPGDGLLNFRQDAESLYLEINRKGEPFWDTSIEWPLDQTELRAAVQRVIAEAESRGYEGSGSLRFRAWNEDTNEDIPFEIGIPRAP